MKLTSWKTNYRGKLKLAVNLIQKEYIKMWKATYLTAALLAIVSFNVMAADAPAVAYKAESFKEVTVEDTRKIVVKEQKNGVFVLAAGGWSGKYPKTTQMIRDIFVARGIKVTDDPASADIGVQFESLADFSFDDIENMSTAINVANALPFLAGGVVGLAGGVASLLDDSHKALMASMSMDAPLSVSGRNKLNGSSKKINAIEIEYKTNQKGADVYVSTLAVFINHYIDNHFVFDVTPERVGQ